MYCVPGIEHSLLHIMHCALVIGREKRDVKYEGEKYWTEYPGKFIYRLFKAFEKDDNH